MSKGFTSIYSGGGEPQAVWMEKDPEGKRFRYAYVIKPGVFDFSAIKPYCERIQFITDGYVGHVDSIREQIEAGLVDFDANKDVVVPVGSAMVAVLCGQIVQRIISENTKWDSFAMGIFLDGSYHFWRIHTDPRTDSYEILLR